MPEAGDYLFSRVGFSREETPVLSFQQNDSFYDLAPLNHKLTLRFTMTQRFCIGWGDIATGERFVCPNANTVEKNYEQCAGCQQRTGFNPAFYHATSVSTQQEARNQEPHMLYLAYFGKGTIKVGISHAARNNARLLEQGARYALILDIFPSAHIAREYEAKIAKIAGIAETIQLRKKISLLEQPLTADDATSELIATRELIETELSITFTQNHVQSLDEHFFPKKRPDLGIAHDCSDQHLISGVTIGMLGSLLFCSHEEEPVFLPLKKYIGFKVSLSYNQTALVIPARQTSFF
ncbi:MAG: hypothetical protein JWP06_306 [Candidatus Saccharibacteria bacterium]|nr:hypothetical protein [Candidatus Saccharibacteria bacterium]